MIRRIRVAFTKDAHLPRFTMRIGATWEFMPHKIEKDGFYVGGGFVTNDMFKVIGWVNETKRLHNRKLQRE